MHTVSTSMPTSALAGILPYKDRGEAATPLLRPRWSKSLECRRPCSLSWSCSGSITAGPRTARLRAGHFCQPSSPRPWILGLPDRCRWNAPPGDAVGHCQIGRANGFCQCIRRFLSDSPVASDPLIPQVHLASVLLAMEGQRYCLDSVAWARHLICLVSMHIDRRTGEWGDSDLLRNKNIMLDGPSESATNKRRRADPHLKFLAASSGQTAEVARRYNITSGNSARDWEEEFLCQHRCATLLSCTGFNWTVSSCLDAARVGRPAREILLHLLWDHKHNVAMVAPPQVARSELACHRLKV